MKTKKISHPRNVLIYLKVLWSGIGMVDGRGKLQGTVMQKGKAGAIARVKVTPVNPQTSFQQKVRSILAQFAGQFRTLTSSQIAGWNAAASSGFKTTNVFGNSFSNSGLSLFVKLNTNLNTVEESPISDAPTPEGVLNPLEIAPTATAGTPSFKINATFPGGGTAVPSETAMVIIATPPISNGRSFVKGLYRVVTYQAAATDTATTSFSTDYAARFGALVAGQKIAVQVNCINTNTGEAGIPFSAVITVGA